MIETWLNGTAFWKSIQSGYQQLFQSIEELNRIKSFPFSDGNTGTNMVYTIKYILENSAELESLSGTLAGVAESSLYGAKGKSGLILAKFFQGLEEALRGKEKITTEQFAHAVNSSSDQIRDIIEKPIEGTILSIIKVWALALKSLSSDINNFPLLLEKAILEVEEYLKNSEIENLKINGKEEIDAGAKGVFLILQGITHYIKTGNIKSFTPPFDNRIIKGNQPLEKIQIQKGVRYRAEAVLEGEAESTKEELEGLLATEANSLNVLNYGLLWKIHLYSDNPTKIFRILTGAGWIIKELNIDDMLIQQHVLSRHNETVLVTDSTLDLPADFIDKYAIHLIPVRIFRGKNCYLDKLSMNHSDIFKWIKEKKFPKTSLPDPRNTEHYFSFLAKNYKNVMVISVSREQSGTYHLFRSFADNLTLQGHNVRVVNSRLNSAAQGLLVKRAALLLDQGIPFNIVLKEIHEQIDRTKLLVAVYDFDWLIKSGRVLPMQGGLAKLVNFKPLVTLDEEGRGVVTNSAFSSAGQIRNLLNQLKKFHLEKGIEEYAVVHTRATERARYLANKIENILGFTPTYIMESSPSISLYAGSKGLAVALVLKKE